MKTHLNTQESKNRIARRQMAEKATKKPIEYYFNPYYIGERELAFVEVWQVLQDEVLGKLYPWQYTASAETSNRIETLNFYALAKFSKYNERHEDTKFIYKVSSRLLTEGNVQRLGNLISPNLFFCFDIYGLEKAGQKLSKVALNYLAKRNANIIIEGVERAPIEVITKYPASYFMLDYRYFNSSNNGLLSMIKQLADDRQISILVTNVDNIDNLAIFEKNNITIFSGTHFNKPRKRLDSLVAKKQSTEPPKDELKEMTQLVEQVVGGLNITNEIEDCNKEQEDCNKHCDQTNLTEEENIQDVTDNDTKYYDSIKLENQDIDKQEIEITTSKQIDGDYSNQEALGQAQNDINLKK